MISVIAAIKFGFRASKARLCVWTDATRSRFVLICRQIFMEHMPDVATVCHSTVTPRQAFKNTPPPFDLSFFFFLTHHRDLLKKSLITFHTIYSCLFPANLQTGRLTARQSAADSKRKRRITRQGGGGGEEEEAVEEEEEERVSPRLHCLSYPPP